MYIYTYTVCILLFLLEIYIVDVYTVDIIYIYIDSACYFYFCMYFC